jgi:AcrR family transcriptional regulator
MEESYLVEPQQARSQETMNKILDAASKILDQKNFDELTVAEVVHEAGTSVGAFYGRFKDKDALLQALDERFFNQFGNEVNNLLNSQDIQNKDLTEAIFIIISFVVDAYSRQKGVLRSLNLRERISYDNRFMEREQYAWNRFLPAFNGIFNKHKELIRHPNPELAINMAYRQMYYTMREIILWQPEPGQKQPINNEILVQELTRSFLSYLGIDQYE